jgi:sigma-E factor negative regulatory protein RseB
MNCRFIPLALGLFLGVAVAPLSASEDPYQWLERMSTAMRELDYQGTFVYVREDEVETVRITHMVSEHGIHERIVSVSGSPREVVRDSSGVLWIAGGDGVVLPNTTDNRNFFPELSAGTAAIAGESYQFLLRGQQRIAGHTGRKLDIVPRDQFRYGYRLWLEPKSGLLLKWELTGEQGETLAKLMFTDLKTGADVNASELRSVTRPASEDSKALATPTPQASSEVPAWEARQLPPGFRLASHSQQPLAMDGQVVHLVYSDGIAAVSVYIEPVDAEAHLSMGLSKMGTTHAYSQQLETLVVTALGDVPAATVRMIGESVGPARP